MRKRRFAPIPVILVLAWGAAACSEDPASGGDLCSEAAGRVTVSGSSTVEPISSLVGEKLLDCSEIEAVVDGPGTGDGFALFCAGDTDISDASRPIKQEEAADCEEAGIDFVELKVAFDGISVLTNPSNDVECVTFEDLYALFGPESEGFGTWADAEELASELGSTTDLPDLPLDITAPGAESGTYDSFLELVLGDISEARLDAGVIDEDDLETSRNDYASQSDDSAIIAAMPADEGSFGFVGFAYAEEAGDDVKELAVSSADGECVAPTADTIADGTYPISRSLYIYVNATRADQDAAVAGFVDHYLSDEGIASVTEAGYVDLPADQLAATRERWDARTTGPEAS